MNILYFLVPVALALAGLGVAAFRWAVNSGQFDDLDSPQFRMLVDDDLTLKNRQAAGRKSIDDTPEQARHQPNQSRTN